MFQGTTKTGKAYGSINLEGYRSSHRIYLFGKDYITYKNYFTKDLSVLIKGRVQPRYKPKDDNDVEFKITEIQLLDDAKKHMIKALTITIPLEHISDTFIESINTITEKYKGKTMLNINVFEKEKGIHLNLFSRTRLVKVNQKMLAEVKALDNVEVALK